MTDLALKDAIDLVYKQTGIINGLWTTYVVATFAAGSFTALNTGEPTTRYIVAAALTLAFGMFTVGNWRMLKAELEAREAIGAMLRAAAPGDGLKDPLERIVGTTGGLVGGRWVHWVIDTCVVVAIWARAIHQDADKALAIYVS